MKAVVWRASAPLREEDTIRHHDDCAREEDEQNADDCVENDALRLVFLTFVALARNEVESGDDDRKHGKNQCNVENEVDDLEDELSDGGRLSQTRDTARGTNPTQDSTSSVHLRHCCGYKH